jgi:hypothetical protein
VIAGTNQNNRTPKFPSLLITFYLELLFGIDRISLHRTCSFLLTSPKFHCYLLAVSFRRPIKPATQQDDKVPLLITFYSELLFELTAKIPLLIKTRSFLLSAAKVPLLFTGSFFLTPY